MKNTTRKNEHRQTQKSIKNFSQKFLILSHEMLVVLVSLVAFILGCKHLFHILF